MVSPESGAEVDIPICAAVFSSEVSKMQPPLAGPKTSDFRDSARLR
jgi:hypothetical protein